MTHPCADQKDLFDDERPCVDLRPPQLLAVTTTMEALFREIADALAKAAKAESGHEQDHR
jgi:hypothetical protein